MRVGWADLRGMDRDLRGREVQHQGPPADQTECGGRVTGLGRAGGGRSDRDWLGRLCRAAGRAFGQKIKWEELDGMLELIERKLSGAFSLNIDGSG